MGLYGPTANGKGLIVYNQQGSPETHDGYREDSFIHEIPWVHKDPGRTEKIRSCVKHHGSMWTRDVLAQSFRRRRSKVKSG